MKPVKPALLGEPFANWTIEQLEQRAFLNRQRGIAVSPELKAEIAKRRESTRAATTRGPLSIDAVEQFDEYGKRTIRGSKLAKGFTTRAHVAEVWNGGTRDEHVAQANAELICAAWNACEEVNPNNPMAVAKAIPRLVEAARLVVGNPAIYALLQELDQS